MTAMMCASAASRSQSWTHGTHSGLVPIGTHSLFLSGAGPTRVSPTQPIVVIEAGIGSSSSEWVVVQRLIARFARVYTYDRAGYGRSKIADGSDVIFTAAGRCADLTKLLAVAGLDPPWVLVGHSYGGTLVREFLLEHGKEKVVGMVIVDSAPQRTPIPDTWPALLGADTYWEVVGVEANHCFTEAEWRQVQDDEKANAETAALEEKSQAESSMSVNERVGGERQLLGNGRLSVVFADNSADFRKIYEWGVDHRNGLDEDREAMRRSLEDMAMIEERGQRAHLALSSQGRFVCATGAGMTHNIQMVQPELIAREVEWVLGL